MFYNTSETAPQTDESRSARFRVNRFPVQLKKHNQEHRTLSQDYCCGDNIKHFMRLKLIIRRGESVIA